jgi:O-antigen biosynthesis protein WbqV
MILTPRRALIMAHDLVATLAAIAGAVYIRFDWAGITDRQDQFVFVLPVFLVYAAVVYYLTGLSQSKWRFTSLPEFYQNIRASTILAVSLVGLDYVLVAPNFYGSYFFGKITIIVYWFLQVFFLSGLRIVYRQFRDTRSRQRSSRHDAVPSLILGRAADAEVLLRAIESGAVKKISAAGILSPSPADSHHTVRGIMVLGSLDDLERSVLDLRARNVNVRRLILTPSAMAADARPEQALMLARRLGLTTSSVPSLEGRSERVTLAPLNVEDLLVRPSVKIDYDRLKGFIAGKAVAVTGGGGSIGSEICRRVVAFHASRLMVLENSEPALHAVTEQLQREESSTEIKGFIADIRDRDRVLSLLRDFKPDLVFHAAALKHVPILERNCGEAVKTNVFGSVNVADAAVDAGASAMVMISTDKAIEPVSVLGATKRLAEMYCQALDASFISQGAAGASMRMISVRFGNVLASNGSVVPKFLAQIEAGGPVTVTHPDMVRYFMTIREACDLVLVSASHALSSLRSAVAVYVLNMGQQVKIISLAQRLIRLSGFEPDVDIKIEFTGVRPGERLQEQIFSREEQHNDINVEGVVAAEPVCPPLGTLRKWLGGLQDAVNKEDTKAIEEILRAAVPDFQPPTLADQKLETKAVSVK